MAVLRWMGLLGISSLELLPSVALTCSIQNMNEVPNIQECRCRLCIIAPFSPNSSEPTNQKLLGIRHEAASKPADAAKSRAHNHVRDGH